MRLYGTLTLTIIVALFSPRASEAAIPDAVHAPNVMVVTAHPDATRVGLQILKAGGNAVDAAVGVAFALSVAEPFGSGIGGGSFTVYRDAREGTVFALDGREEAPGKLSTASFHPDGKYDSDLARWSGLAVGVPGLVLAMHQLHARFGKLTFSQCLKPVVEMSRKGTLVTSRLAGRIKRVESKFTEATRTVFLPGGEVPELGVALVQADQANTIERIGNEGPDAFYAGDIAEKIVAAVQAAGGVMTLKDLAAYKPRWRDPVAGKWSGLDIYSFPPPSSGGAVLMRLLHGVGSGADLKASGWNSANTVHVLTELMKRSYADRNHLLADPDHVAVPLERFVDPAAGAKDRKAVRNRSTPAKKILNPKKLLKKERLHTSHFSIVDADGNALSQTQTINLTFGSGIVASGTGILLNNEMDDFATSPGKQNAFGLVQGSVNEVQPGKRPLSSMTPTIVVRDGKVDAVVGSPGGSFIITSVFQAILNRYIFDMSPSEAVCMPRIHHQWLPDYIQAERFSLSADTALRLAKKKHLVHEVSEFGNVQAIFRVKSGWAGAPDCRGEGVAGGY